MSVSASLARKPPKSSACSRQAQLPGAAAAKLSTAAGEPGLAGGRCRPAAGTTPPASQPPLLPPPAALHPGGLCSGGARLQGRGSSSRRGVWSTFSEPSNRQWGNRHTSGSSGAVPVLACKAYCWCPAPRHPHHRQSQRCHTLHPGCCRLPGPVTARPQPPRWICRAAGA